MYFFPLIHTCLVYGSFHADQEFPQLRPLGDPLTEKSNLTDKIYRQTGYYY